MNHNEIKAGDLIQVTAVIKADTVVRSGDGKTTIRFVNSSGRSAQVRLDDNDLVTLIERPLPPLPTELGSVIETGHVRWFLREDFDAEPRWVATGYGINNTPDELLRIVKANGGFEVLL